MLLPKLFYWNAGWDFSTLSVTYLLLVAHMMKITNYRIRGKFCVRKVCQRLILCIAPNANCTSYPTGSRELFTRPVNNFTEKIIITCIGENFRLYSSYFAKFTKMWHQIWSYTVCFKHLILLTRDLHNHFFL